MGSCWLHCHIGHVKYLGKDKSALFAAQWTAPFLLLDFYNKIVKTEGLDSKSRPSNGHETNAAKYLCIVGPLVPDAMNKFQKASNTVTPDNMITANT